MFELTENLKQLDQNGITVIPEVLSGEEVVILRSELIAAIDEDHIKRPNVFDAGMVHNCMFRGGNMMSLLDCEVMSAMVSKVLSPSFIIYAYQSSSLRPTKGGLSFGSRVHVDSPRFIADYITNVGVIFALDDFTDENGATLYLKGSHLSESVPTDDFFYSNASSALCKAGDMIVFNARLFHAAGHNRTSQARHALTINFCRSYMRTRFDFGQMLAAYNYTNLSDNTKKLLGWDVRMPKSLDEFYLPESERLYKPNQG